MIPLCPEVTCRMRRVVFIQRKAAQDTSGKGARIDIDAVGADFWSCDRRVAVYHDLFECRIVIPRVLANPQEIAFRLLRKGNTRPCAPRRRKGSPTREAQLQERRKSTWVGGSRSTSASRRRRKFHSPPASRTFALEERRVSRPPKSTQPGAELLGVIDEGKQHLLMIALKPSEGAPFICSLADKELNDGGGIRAAVDVVTNGNDAARCPLPEESMSSSMILEHARREVGMTVNVANGVHPAAGGKAGACQGALCNGACMRSEYTHRLP